VPEQRGYSHFQVTLKAPVPAEQTALTEKEREAVAQVAQQRGITFEEAVEQMAKEGLASRVRSKTGRMPAKVYELRRKP
jgi:predicted kinase